MAKGNSKTVNGSALDFKADFSLADPPFNMSDRSRSGGMLQDTR